MQTRNPSTNALIFDSENVPFGMCLGVYTVPASTTWSRNWPALAGCQIRVTTIYGSTAAASVSYPGSIPTMSVASASYAQTFIVYATGAPTTFAGPGIQCRNRSGGGIALSSKGRGLNYIGKASLQAVSAAVGAPSNTAMDGAFNRPAFTTVRISSANQPVGVVKVAGGLRFCPDSQFIQTSPGVWDMRFCSLVTAPSETDNAWPSAVTPEVHCWAAPSATGNVTLRDPETGEIAYNLTSSPLLDLAGRLEWPVTELGTVRALPVPVAGALGDPGYSEVRSFQVGTQARYRVFRYAGAFFLDGTSLVRQRMAVGMTVQDGFQSNTVINTGSVVEIINLNGY